MAMPHCYLLGISVYYVHLLYVCLSNKLTTKCVSEMEYEFDKVCHVCQNTQMLINRLKNQNTATPVYLDVKWFCSLQAFQISCSSEAELPVSIPVLTSYFLLFCCRVFLLAHGVMLSGVSIIRVRSQWSFQCINGAVSTKEKTHVICCLFEMKSCPVCDSGRQWLPPVKLSSENNLWFPLISLLVRNHPLTHLFMITAALWAAERVSLKHTQLAYNGGKGCTNIGTHQLVIIIMWRNMHCKDSQSPTL